MVKTKYSTRSTRFRSDSQGPGRELATVSQSKRLSSVTTQSLDALRQYSIATERASALQWDEAKVYLENALRIRSHVHCSARLLGMMHVEQAINGWPDFDGEEGKRLLSEAVKHVDGRTDREKYGILAFMPGRWKRIRNAQSDT